MGIHWGYIGQYGVAVLMLVFSIMVHADQSVSEISVNDDRSLFARAVVMSRQGDWNAAAKLYRDIAARNPSWPEPKNNLAVAMMHIGQLEKAQQALEEAVSSQPSFRTAQSNRSRLYDYLAALAYHRAIGEQDSGNLPQLDLLTRIQAPVVESMEKVQRPVKPRAEPTDPSSSSSVSQRIKQRLLGWSRAWEAADVDSYLSAYSPEFTPDEPGRDYNQWKNIRRARLQLASNTRVKLHNVRVYVEQNDNRAIAEFIQSYQSDTYQDRVIKQLHMALHNDRWLIMSERVIEKLD